MGCSTSVNNKDSPPTDRPFSSSSLSEINFGPFISDKDFTSLQPLTRGSFGLVYLAIYAQSEGGKRSYVAKKLDRTKVRERSIVREAQILLHLSQTSPHVNVIECLGCYVSPEEVTFIFPFYKGGNLLEFMTQRNEAPLSEAEARCVLRQVVAGVSYLNSRNILHRDLKPENIFLSSPSCLDGLRIGDFGLSALLLVDEDLSIRALGERVLSSSSFSASSSASSVASAPPFALDKVCGTWSYSAPEMLSYPNSYDWGFDIYSVGIILLYLLSGKHPFDPHKVGLIIAKERAKAGDFNFRDLPLSVGTEARALLCCLLEKDREKRIRVEDILDHPFFLLH